LFKSKINLKKKNILISEAEKIISDFNKLTKDLSSSQDPDDNYNQVTATKDNKETKISKSSSNIKKKIKKVSKK